MFWNRHQPVRRVRPIATITDCISAKFPTIPATSFCIVDVRDVARLHVKALTANAATGKRFMAATAYFLLEI
ncbi:MAG: hypothetical protein ACI8Y4_004838 [Candidatus Poriferisodalaceae bacterium]|jgi:hypothetical protein